MKLNYSLSPKDFLQLQLYLNFMTPAAKRFSRLMQCLFPPAAFSLFIMPCLLPGFPVDDWTIASTCVLILLLTFTLPLIVKMINSAAFYLKKFFFKTGACYCGDFSLELLDDGLAEISSDKHLHIDGRDIRNVAADRRLLYIFRNLSEVTIVPVTAFKYESEYNELMKKLQRWTGLTLDDLRLEGRPRPC